MTETETTRNTLKVCGYPGWSIEKVRNKIDEKDKKNQERRDQGEEQGGGIWGVLEALISRIFPKRRVSTAMISHTTSKGLLVHPKDKTDPKKGVHSNTV